MLRLEPAEFVQGQDTPHAVCSLWNKRDVKNSKGQLNDLIIQSSTLCRHSKSSLLVRHRRRVNESDQSFPRCIISGQVFLANARKEVVVRNLWLDATNVDKSVKEVGFELRSRIRVQNCCPFALSNRNEITLRSS